MRLDEPLDDSACHQVTDRTLRDEVGIVGDVHQARQAAGTGFGIPVAEHHIRHRIVRQRVQQCWIMTADDHPKVTAFGYARQPVEELLRAAGMHAVVDLLNDDQTALWCRQHRCRDRQHAERTIRQQRCIVVVAAAERFSQFDHDLAARRVDEVDAANVLFRQGSYELEQLILRSVFPAQIVQHAGEISSISIQSPLIGEAVPSH